MSDLIVPDRALITPNRRSFVKNTGIVLASLIAGPTIAKYANLMDIDTKQNRLVVAYNGYTPGELIPSLLNLTDYTPGDIDIWSEGSREHYHLVRQAAISPKWVGKFGGADNWTPEKIAYNRKYVRDYIEKMKRQPKV